MAHYIDYKPAQHEGKTLYAVEDANDNHGATELRKVTSADELEKAKHTPWFYVVDEDE